MKTCRIYMRVSSQSQDLDRQEYLIDKAKKEGFYIAGIYREKMTGTNVNRPQLQKLIEELQKDDVIIAEDIDRITRLPIDKAEELFASIKAKGAKFAIDGIIDFSDIIAETNDEITQIVLDACEKMLIKIVIAMARANYEKIKKRTREGIELAKEKGRYKGRQENKTRNAAILEMRKKGFSISRTIKLSGAGKTTVLNVWKNFKDEVFSDFNNKMNVNQIAAKHNCDIQLITKLIEEMQS